MCSPKIGVARTDEVAKVLGWALDQGHTVVMMTLTARHHGGDRLKPMWDGLSTGWRQIVQGWGSESEAAYARRLAAHEAAWEDYRAGLRPRRPRELKPRRIGIYEQIGGLGYVRATETTHGDLNGWHVHYHVLVVLNRAVFGLLPDQAEALANFRRSVFGLWSKGLAKQGLTAVERVHQGDGEVADVGVDVRALTGAEVKETVSTYVTKMTDSGAAAAAAAAAREVTLGQFKKGRRGSRTPFEILADVQHDGAHDEQGTMTRDADLWAEWCDGSRGRRQMVWSRGLRRMAGLDEAERSDEEIASEEQDDRDFLTLSRKTWFLMRDTQRRWDLLAATNKGGAPAAVALLDQWGYSYQMCDPQGWPVEPPSEHDPGVSPPSPLHQE